MRELESGCNLGGIDGAGDEGTETTATVVIVDNMRKVLIDGLKGVVNSMAAPASKRHSAYATVPPLPPMQVRRIEVQRGKTLQEKRAGAQGLWQRKGLTKRGKLGDWKDVSKQRAWNVMHSGERCLQEEAVSGSFMNGTIGSFHSAEKDIRPFVRERTGNSLGPTASPLVQSICTVRKRCMGISAGTAISTESRSLSIQPPQTAEPIKLERPHWGQASRNRMLLQHNGNTKYRFNEVGGDTSASKCFGQSLYGFAKKDGLNTTSANCCFQKNRFPVRSGRQEEFLTCKTANPLVFDKEKEWLKDMRPQREHWWKDWMKDRKNTRRDLTAPENLTRFGVFGINGTGEIRISSRRVSNDSGFVGLIPPTGTPVRGKRAKTLQIINTKEEGVESGLKFFMRGARIQGSCGYGWLSKARSGEGISKFQCIGVDDGNISVGSVGPQRQEWQAVRLREFDSNDTGVDSENMEKLIATSWSPREDTNNTVGARIEVRPLLPYSIISSDTVTTTRPNLKRVPFTSLPPGINESLCDCGSSISAGTNTGSTSTPTPTVAVRTTLYGVTPPTRVHTVAHFPPLLPPDSISSIDIPKTQFSMTSRSHAHLQFLTHRPLVIATRTPAVSYFTPHPTRQLLLQKFFELHIKPYGSLLLPPLSRVLYEKWRKHSTPLYQEEPSAEEGSQLGLGHGGRERDRWLRLRSASYEGEDGGDKFLVRGMKRRCSDPGVRRCVGRLWIYAVDLARKLEEGCPSHKIIMEGSDEAIPQQRIMGQAYFPEWFSPSGYEEVYRFLRDDTPARTDDDGDPDVEFVLRYAARQMHRDIAELLRIFSEETFLNEVDSRLEWWWLQTRGSAAGIGGREAERRRKILLKQEGRGQNTSLEMEKEYFDSYFKVELEDGVKWGQEWRWELDVPNGVRDAGAYCYPHPPRSAGGWYVGAKNGSIHGTTKYPVIERRQPRLRCMYNTNRIRRMRPSRQRILEQAKRIVRGEKMTWEKLRAEVRKRWETNCDLLTDVTFFAKELEAPLVRIREQLGNVGNGVSEPNTSTVIINIESSTSEQTTTCFETAVSSIMDDQSCSDPHVYFDADASTPGNINTIDSNIKKANPQPLYTLTPNCGVHPMPGISRSRGKGMTIVLKHRRRRYRAQSTMSGVKVGGSVLNKSGGCPYPLRASTGSPTSSKSGYIAGDEDSNPLVALQLSSPPLTSFNLTANTNATSSMRLKPENRVLNFMTDTSETNPQSVKRVDHVTIEFEEEWDCLCGLRDSTEREDRGNPEIYEGGGVYEIQNGSASESDEMELDCVELEDQDSDDSEEKPEIDLIPEDVRGSWGRNGGYLGLDSMRNKVSGVKRHKRRRKEFLDCQVSVPRLGLGWASSSGSSSLGRRQVPWFLNFRSSRMPEISSSTGGNMDSDKETRMLERMREFGRQVREVSGANKTTIVAKELGVSSSVAEIVEGTNMGRDDDCEMEFWGMSIRKGIEGLFGPVKVPVNVDTELCMEELD